MSELSDQQLINNYFQGDDNALEFLIRRYLADVFKFVYHLVGNSSDAEDITQETFIKAWRNLKKFDRQKSFKPWILRIAKNTCVDFWRRKKNIAFSAMAWDSGENDLAEEIRDTKPLPSEIWDRQNLETFVAEILKSLPINDRLVLILHYNDHLTFQEIADISGISLNTVKSRHLRAILKLRKRILE